VSYLPGEILFGYLAEIEERSEARTISKTYTPNLDDYDIYGAHHNHVDYAPWTYGDSRYDFPTNRIEEHDLKQYNHRTGGEIRGRKVSDVTTGGGDREAPGSANGNGGGNAK
jgi:hypothetical protein